MMKKIVYTVTSKKNWCTTKVFETLEEAISWCKKQKTKLGHRVDCVDRTEKYAEVTTVYETFGNKQV